MKDKKTKIQKQTIRIIRVIRNILVNGFNEIFSNSKYDKVKKIISEHKSVIITSTIIALFIFKNFYTIISYNSEIKEANEAIAKQTGINNQLKEDIEYYKTDEFILRYSLEELNLRPTKELELYHGEILPYDDEEEEIDKTTDIEDENPETSSENEEEINDDNSDEDKKQEDDETSQDEPLQP